MQRTWLPLDLLLGVSVCEPQATWTSLHGVPPSDMTQVFWMIWAMNVCMCVSVVLLFRVHIPFPVVLRHLMELSSFNQNGKAKETKVLRREWLSSHVPEEVTTNLVTVPTPLG